MMGDGLTVNSMTQELNEIQSWLREQGEHRKANMIDIATGFVNRSENIQNAVFVLRQKLKDDPNMFYGWQSNIAMCICDKIKAKKKLGYINNKKLHEMCNQGAVEFLNVLIKD